MAQLSPQLSSTQSSLNQGIPHQLQLSEAALQTLLNDHVVTVEIDGQNIELIIDEKGEVQIRQIEPVIQSGSGLLEANLGGVNMSGNYGLGMGIGTALTSIENTIVTPAQKTPISSVLSPPPDACGASSSGHHHHVTKNRPIAMKMPQAGSEVGLFGPGRPELSPEDELDRASAGAETGHSRHRQLVHRPVQGFVAGPHHRHV